MTRRLRRATFLALLVLGCFGLLGTGSGVLAGPSWVWLAVLVLAVMAQVAGDHYGARQRLARRTERRISEVLEGARRQRQTDLDALTARFEGLLQDTQHLANELKPIREDWESVRTTGGLRSLLKR